MNLLREHEETFCGGFHCSKIDVCSDEAATKFHGDSLCSAAAHEAVEDDIAGIR